MVPVLIATLALTAVAAPPSPVASPAPATRCEAMTERLRVAAPLKPIVAEMCRRAPTFRRQVARLARESTLDVSVATALFPPRGRARARTAISRVDGLLRRAVVEVPEDRSLQIVELLAHEFEHILEQLDGVDLATWAGRSGVHRVLHADRDGPFETERARQVGRLVVGEFMAAEAAITARRSW